MRITIIGCGTIGGALARHFSKNHKVTLFDQITQTAEHLAAEIHAELSHHILKAASHAEVIILAVKPQDLSDLASSIGALCRPNQLIISSLAGVEMQTLRKHFPQAPLLRMMPNLPMTQGAGVIGLVESSELSGTQKEEVSELFKGLGLLLWMPENKIDALTALSGSGPAFLLVILESMIEAGISMGLTAAAALDISLKTMEGTVALVRGEKKHPAEIKWKITSPGGTTITGLEQMERSGVRTGITQTFLAAYAKAKQLG